MKLSEGLMLASTLPLCRQYWQLGEAECLLTSLGRVVGIEIGTNPILLFGVFPLLSMQVDSVVGVKDFVWRDIVRRFDGSWVRGIRQHSVDEIVTWVRQLEAEQEAQAQPQQEECHAVS